MAIAIDQDTPLADRYKVFLRLFSILYQLNLSEKEIEVLNAFCLYEKGIISRETRKRVAAKLQMSAYSVNNYLFELRKRNVVTTESLNEKLIINIMPANKTLSIIFNLNDASKG